MLICSMNGIFAYIYHEIQPNVGKYTIHGSTLWDWMMDPMGLDDGPYGIG